MKPSREGSSAMKPTREELQARVESLAKKKRRIKRKAQALLESSLTLLGKISRLGASSPSSTAKERGSSDQVPVRGQAPSLVWSPSVQDAKLPPTTPEDEGRDCFGTEGDEDSLLTNSELTVGVVSSIIQDSNLKKADAMSVEEALASSLQGAATVCPDAFICSFHRCFKLSINFISFL